MAQPRRMDSRLAQQIHGHGDCWYCGAKTGRRRAGAQKRTREHLVPKSGGGGNHWKNIRFACLRCNGVAGDWSLDQKVRLRSLLRSESWEAVAAKIVYGTKGWRFRLLSLVSALPEPEDEHSRVALDLAGKYGVRRDWNDPPQQTKKKKFVPVLDVSGWVMALGRLPSSAQPISWEMRFTIGDRELIFPGGSTTFAAAKNRVMELARSWVVERPVLHPPRCVVDNWCETADGGVALPNGSDPPGSVTS